MDGWRDGWLDGGLLAASDVSLTPTRLLFSATEAEVGFLMKETREATGGLHVVIWVGWTVAPLSVRIPQS